MPNTVQTSTASGHMTPDPDEWEVAGRPLYAVYPDVVQYDIRTRIKVAWIPAIYLDYMNMTVAPLDLATGTTAVGAESCPGELQQQSDPLFIQPLDRSQLVAFCRKHDKRPPTLRDPWLSVDSEDEEDKLPVEDWKPDWRLEVGQRTVECLLNYVCANRGHPTECANPTWKEGVVFYPDRPGQSWITTGGFMATGNCLHSITFITNSYAWPRDGRISTAELYTIAGALSAYRNVEADDDDDDDDDDAVATRHIPATVVSASGKLVRIVHAWDDAENPFSLNIRVSPPMQPPELPDQDDDWMKLCCFIMGNPIDPDDDLDDDADDKDS